jgi:hypothetical protein
MPAGSTKQTFDVRERLSQVAAEVLNTATTHVRVRVHLAGGQPARAVLLSHRDNTWHEEPYGIVDPDQLAALDAELAMLATLGHAGDVMVRQFFSQEFRDTDIQFRSDWVTAHRGQRLASYVEGVLFFDAPGSKKDVRRKIRTPHRGA